MSISDWRNRSRELCSSICVVFTSSQGSLHRKSLRSGKVMVPVKPVVSWGERSWIEEVDSSRLPV